jgi:hypothetical protein
MHGRVLPQKHLPHRLAENVARHALRPLLLALVHELDLPGDGGQRRAEVDESRIDLALLRGDSPALQVGGSTSSEVRACRAVSSMISRKSGGTTTSTSESRSIQAS